MTESVETRAEKLNDLANRKLSGLWRRSAQREAERLARILHDGEMATTIGIGNLEGSTEAFVMVTDENLILANAPILQESKAFVQRLSYREIEDIRIEIPGLMTRWTITGTPQAHLTIRTRGETIRLKLMEKHRAEEIRDLVADRAEW